MAAGAYSTFLQLKTPIYLRAQRSSATLFAEAAYTFWVYTCTYVIVTRRCFVAQSIDFVKVLETLGFALGAACIPELIVLM